MYKIVVPEEQRKQHKIVQDNMIIKMFHGLYSVELPNTAAFSESCMPRQAI